MANMHSKAYSLIELLFVLSIIGLFVITMLNTYQKKRFENEVNFLEADAEQLGQSLNAYYYSICKTLKQTQVVSLQDLQKAGVLLPTALKQVSWVTFTMEIRVSSTGSELLHQLIVSAKIDQPQKIINFIRDKLQGVSFTDPTVISWVRLPSQQAITRNTSNWIMGAGLAQFNKIVAPGSLSQCHY